MNLKSVKCQVACLAVLVAAAASAAVPARFCEYIESSTSGATATYVDTGLKPHYINGKFFVDTELVDSTLPSNLRYLFGIRRQSAIDNQSLVVCLDGANGKFRLDTLYKSATEFVTANAVAGHRYRFTVRKRYNYNGERCDLEDVTTGAFTRYGSSAAKYSGNAYANFLFFTVNVASTKQTATVPQRMYAAKIWNDGSTLSGDYIPCVDSSGKFGLYDVVSDTIKLASPQENFTASAANSPFARVVDGAIEYCAHLTAEAGAQISIDGGETWVSSADVWTKAGGDSFTVMARPDPAVPFAVFTGWRAGSPHRLDFSGGSGLSTAALTLPAGKVRDIAATAKVGGYEPEQEFFPTGSFETYDYGWDGGGARGACDTTYASTVAAAMGSYCWRVDNGTGNLTNPDLRRYNIPMPPAKYKLSYGAAVSNSQTLNNVVAGLWNTADSSSPFTGSSLTNSITKTYTVYSKSFTFGAARTATLRISRTANSTYKHSFDNVSLKMQLPVSGVVVTAEPEEYQIDAAPSYKWFPMQDGRTDTFTAPSGTAFLNADETARGYVRGYRVDTYDTATGTWTRGEEVASLSYAHTQSANECKRLVWLWAAENKISVVSQSATELVSTNGTDWVSSFEEWFPYASTPPIYAGTTPDTFYIWSGAPAGTVYGARNAVINVPMNAPRTLTLLDTGFVATHVWAGPSAAFSSADAWRTPSGAVSDTAPDSESIVYIPPASTCTVSRAFSVGALYIGDALKTGAAGTVSVTFSCGLVTNEVAGALVIGKGATLTHDGNGSGKVATQQLNLKAGSSIAIAAGASINVKGMGFNNSQGPAPGANNTKGGSHAGVGADSASVNTYQCYGSIRKPTMPGSGGGSKGGGVVYLSTPGTLQLDGTIDACGANITYYRSGAGGSVFLEVGTLSGSGSVDVRGGSGTYTYQGGSGRISVVESVATSFGFAGTLNAGCINTRSGNGTIYLENASDAPGQGELIVDARGTSLASDCVCRLDAAVPDRGEPFSKVTVKRNGRLQIPAGCTLKVVKGIDTTGGYISTATTGGAIEFMPGEGGTCDVTGTLRAYSFFCTNSPNATLRFANGAVLTNFNNGASAFLTEAGRLSMLPATAEAKWNFDIGSGVSMEASRLAVSNCTARGVAFGAVESSDLGGNENCNFTSAIQPGDPITWTGAEDTLWGNSNNWQPSRTPVDTDVVTIPANCPNYPVISGNDVVVNTLTNAAGATLTLRGVDLTVTNALTSAGTLVFSGWENLILAGDGEQKVDFANTAITRITVDKPAGSVTFEHGFKVNEVFKCNSSDPLAFYFAPGETYDIDQLFVDGMVQDGEGGVLSKITMASSAAPGKWLLKATKSQRVRGVAVSDCNATIGETIHAGLLSYDGQGNTGWDFSESAAAEWTGAANTTFSNAANWLPAVAPGADTYVTITPKRGATSTVAVSAATSVKNLILGGDLGAVAFTSSAKLSVGDNFEVRTNATATLNYFAEPNEVTNSVMVRSGGKITHGSATANGPKLYVSAGEDITVESGGAICADGLASGGAGAGSGNIVAASHGGVGSGSDLSKCYGSIFEPFYNGSKGNRLNGGGTVRLVAGGQLHIDGRVTAYGLIDASGGAGSGGSIWLTAGVISGRGVISANCVSVYATGAINHNYTGGGGRIALYQTSANDWSELHITPTAAGSVANDVNKGDCGTIYWQLPSDVSHGGRIEVPGKYANKKGTAFPASGDGDPRKAYANASLFIGKNAYFHVTNSVLSASGGMVRVRDIDIEAATTKIFLYENTIKVLSAEHKKGKGWTAGSDYAQLVESGAINTSLGGKIVWPVGMKVTIR